MQDEVNEKVVSLCIRGGKISAQILKSALLKTLTKLEQQKSQRKQKKGVSKEEKNLAVYKGKQSMEKLKEQNCELSNIEITDGNIKSFEKYARKYNVDYCLKKDRSSEPPRYYVFFKARDVDSMTAAFKELLWSSIFVTLMANKIGGLQFGIYRNCQISSRVFHTAVAALPLTKANRSDFE